MIPGLDGLSLEQLCGQLFIVGFDGTELPEEVASALRAGMLGGIILFRRNLIDLESTWRLCRDIHAAFPIHIPPFVGIDEEGGRVSRLPPPFMRLPPMRWFGQRDDVAMTRRAATWLGRHLARLGITCNFAPVLDVDTNAQNPIIGDRSFSSDPAVVSRHARVYIEALQQEGIGACGKHFPGHGDTAADSHVVLPTVDCSRERLECVELRPFRDCAAVGLAGLMTAHVKYPNLDPTCIATFSEPIVTAILRRTMGFDGVVFSDDLEMGAVANHTEIGTAACKSIQAGCDVLLVCRNRQAALRAQAAVLLEARSSSSMRERVVAAATRFAALRRRFEPQASTMSLAPPESFCFEV